MKKILGSLAAVCLMLPAIASAQSSGADLQAQAQALLQQVAQLQAQLAAQQGGSANTNLNTNASGAITLPTQTAGGGNACPNIGRILKRGSTGDEVTRLQQFLALDPSIYPEGTVSGYYGALTEKAVQRWQAKNNIISSGSPATTGWGQVGPRTAAAIALLCSTGASGQVGGYIQVSPISGNAPLNVNVVATVNSTNSCSGAIYTLSWGDGSNPITIPVSANNCQPVSQTYQHLYAGGGTFQIILASGSHQTGAVVTVYGNAVTPSPTPSGAPPSGETFNATPRSGATPLTVTFSGVVTGADQGWCASGCSDILDFGDGQQGAVPLPTSQSGSQSYSIQHVYTSAGSFTARLYQGQAGSGRALVGAPITITPGGSGGSSSTYNPPTLTPNAGGNVYAVQLGFDVQACGSYTIAWGDSGGSVPGSAPCGGTGNATQTAQHTYAASGNFTITLTRGSQIDTVGVNIAN